MDATLTFIVIVGAVVYFLPTIAALRGDRFGAVLVINLFLGWTLIGWVAAFAIAVSSKDVKRTKICPVCIEDVLAEAQVCRFCGHVFSPPPPPPPAAPKPEALKLAAVALAIGALAWSVSQAQITNTAQATTTAAPIVQAEPVRIVVPEPDPTAQGILLDRTARANAPLVPLVP